MTDAKAILEGLTREQAFEVTTCYPTPYGYTVPVAYNNSIPKELVISVRGDPKYLVLNALGLQVRALIEEQRPLGTEFEAVWDANTERLYEP